MTIAQENQILIHTFPAKEDVHSSFPYWFPPETCTGARNQGRFSILFRVFDLSASRNGSQETGVLEDNATLRLSLYRRFRGMGHR
jgi:hypothetical protein